MKIVADENIPYVKEAFAELGQVECRPGRDLTAECLRETEILLVRSITAVNAQLLEKTAVRFVGTATIGTDHIDREYLKSRTIEFASAAGSNSRSVAEYVIAALLKLAQRDDRDLRDKTIGIIGVGNIGSKVEKMAQSLGMIPLLNDPPLQKQTNDPKYISLEQTLQADFITCHVPLTQTGPWPTWHLLNKKILKRLTPHATLINTSRGPVVDNQSLKDCLQAGTIGPVVLDVWENEPDIDVDLLAATAIGTPHIAGYSFDGKVNGTVMLYEAVCRFLGQPATFDITDHLPAPLLPTMELLTSGQTDQKVISKAMHSIYNIGRDDAELREMAGLPAEGRGGYFDRLRKQYPVRREAMNTRIMLKPHKPELAQKLSLLGFQIAEFSHWV